MNKQRFIIALLLVIFSSCNEVKKPVESAAPAPTPVAEPATAPTPPVQPAPEKKPAGLAVLVKLKNRADTRAHNESVWQAASTGAAFLKHDALQTHNSAAANVRYESGSQLDLRENTLVIFDKDPGASGRSPDRVLLKNGKLTGATKKELWVFTNAGLVQIKPVKKNQQAQATLSVDSARKLTVNVATGSAEVILKKSDTEFKKFTMSENSEHGFTADADFGIASDAPAVPAVKNPSLAELVIDSPTDGAISSTAEFEVRGKLTEMGAKLLINGQLADVADDLTFQRTVSLTEGSNLIVFQIVRSDASVKFYRKSIRYDKSR